MNFARRLLCALVGHCWDKANGRWCDRCGMTWWDAVRKARPGC